MKPRDRRLQIVDIIRQQGRVSVDLLVEKFSSSPETIRRDLKKLSRRGEIRKVHGGAMLPNAQGEGEFQQRMGENVSAKRKVAENAKRLISPGDTILIDTGSTTLIFAEEISQIKNLTVITNSVEIAKVMCFAKESARVFLLGGEYHPDNRETTGSLVISQLNNFHAQHAILTIAGINTGAGAMDYDIGEVAVAKAMLERAQNSILLADSSKFNRSAPLVVGSLDKFNQLVCEVEPDRMLKEALVNSEVEIIC